MADYFGSLNRILGSLKGKLGLQNLIPGTKGYQLAESIAYEQTIIESKIDEYARKNSIFSATGEDLDRIGADIFGIYRLKEEKTDVTKTMKVLKFYVDVGVFGDINRSSSTNLPQSITLPIGTTISGSIDNINYTYITEEEYVLDSTASEKYISALLMQGDVTLIPTNTLTEHSFTNYSTGASKLLKVTNPSPINTGRTTETDENYRYRISNSLRSHLTSTYAGVESTLLQIPGVSYLNIVNATAGGGTFTVFVQGTTPITSDDVIERCTIELQHNMPPWVTFNILKPYYVGIEAIINVTVKQKSDTITTNVVSSVSNYINNFGGQDFYVNSILQQAQLADSNILDVSFNLCRKHYGSDEYRVYETVDTTLNTIITVFNLEKLIVEPIPSAITVNQIT